MPKLRFSILAILIALAAFSRLIPHPYNFAPITAMALFGGAHFFDPTGIFEFRKPWLEHHAEICPFPV